MLAWVGTTTAFATQVDQRLCIEAMQSLSAIECQPCAIGSVIPAAEQRLTESDDHPEAMSGGHRNRIIPAVLNDEAKRITAVQPPLALRILYCRWLN